MTDMHAWEEVYSTKRAVGGFATIISRFRVPGGWIYVHTVMRFHWFRRDEIYVSSNFVPDPSEQAAREDIRR